MNRAERDLVIRRILVALDASSHSQAALETAAQLAARFGAELLGLFIEDVNLLRLAQLPFAYEVSIISTTRRRLDSNQIERQLRVQARRVRRTFTTITQRIAVTATFRVTRGDVVSELLSAAEEVDMIVLGRVGWTPAPRHLGSTARAIILEAPALTLILQKETSLGPPVVVVYDGSPLAEKALAAAGELLEPGETLTVFLLAEEEEAGRRLRERAAEYLHGRSQRAYYRLLQSSSASQLGRAVLAEPCGTLVLPAKRSLLEEDAVETLLEAIQIPILLVR